MSDDLEQVLRDAGYEIADVERPESGIGCMVCGRSVESVEGVCIRCAAKDAPTHWDGPAPGETP